MLAKRRLLASLFLVLTFLGGGCSGSGIYEGRGGASKNVNGVDIWLVGTPPRKFRIIGYITDSRPGGAIPMARRDADLAAEAKKNGGDGILLKAKQTDFLGTYPTGNATAIASGNVTTAVGSGVSVPIIRREGQYFDQICKLIGERAKSRRPGYWTLRRHPVENCGCRKIVECSVKTYPCESRLPRLRMSALSE